MHCLVKLRLSRIHEGKSNSNGLNHVSQSDQENLFICYISNVFTCTSVVLLQLDEANNSVFLKCHVNVLSDLEHLSNRHSE